MSEAETINVVIPFWMPRYDNLVTSSALQIDQWVDDWDARDLEMVCARNVADRRGELAADDCRADIQLRHDTMATLREIAARYHIALEPLITHAMVICAYHYAKGWPRAAGVSRVQHALTVHRATGTRPRQLVH